MAINSMISLWVHSLLPLMQYKYVEGFTTDAILLTAALVLGSVQYY